MDPVIGSTIQDFRIVSLISRGGMGDVYLGQHPLIGKKIAIKILKPKYAGDQDSLIRFFREAQTVNEIHHENVIDIFNLIYRPEEGKAYILMEYLEGHTLAAAIAKEAPFPAHRVGHIGLQICSALNAAHTKGIVHRDLKSENIFLIPRAGQKDFVKVLDFGLVKLREGDPTKISQTGFTLGTPSYMSPEQALGEQTDEQTDIYSLGVVLYEIATRTLPFTGSSSSDIMRKHVTAPLPPPRERFSAIDPRLEKVIIRCLQKDKKLRYRSMFELSYALAAACDLDAATYLGHKFLSTRLVALPSAGTYPKNEVDEGSTDKLPISPQFQEQIPTEQTLVDHVEPYTLSELYLPSLETSRMEEINAPPAAIAEPPAPPAASQLGASQNEGLLSIIGIIIGALLFLSGGVLFFSGILHGLSSSEPDPAEQSTTATETE